ncbi:MAG: hypothetical protein F6K03_09955 [Kamptonema sp. SIO4C4]|nr:hypothetical protein [Kamptonema sp. SIO4C4]
MNQPLEDFHNYCRNYAHTTLQGQGREVQMALMRRQIPPQKVRSLESCYDIQVTLDDTLPLKPVQPLLLKQIEATAEFLRDFHIGILGQRTTIFQLYEIEFLVSQNSKKFTFDFSTGKLLIELPYRKLRWRSDYLKYPQLRQQWNEGKHLPKTSPVRRLWWLFNPIGEFRSNLKSTLFLAIQKRVLGIDKLLVRFGIQGNEGDSEPEPSKVPDSFKEGVLSYLKSAVDEEKLGFKLELLLENYDDQGLIQLLKQFKDNLTSPQGLEEMVDVATFTLKDYLTQEQSNVNIRMFGFVNVGNYHRIDVDLHLSSGYLQKYVEVIPRKADIKATLFGFVNVYTIDDITVSPNLHSAVKIDFSTAALEKVVLEKN